MQEITWWKIEYNKDGEVIVETLLSEEDMANRFFELYTQYPNLNSYSGSI